MTTFCRSAIKGEGSQPAYSEQADIILLFFVISISNGVINTVRFVMVAFG